MRFLALRARNDSVFYGLIWRGMRVPANLQIPSSRATLFMFLFVIPSPEGARNLNQFVKPLPSDTLLQDDRY
jgi:hypothetical protein